MSDFYGPADRQESIATIHAALEAGKITAYGVLSRGLISGHWSKERSKGSRAMFSRFQGENLDNNLRLVEKLRAIAPNIGCSVAQVAIGWVAAQGDDIVPLIGARRRDRLSEALGTLALRLSAEHDRCMIRLRTLSPSSSTVL